MLHVKKGVAAGFVIMAVAVLSGSVFTSHFSKLEEIEEKKKYKKKGIWRGSRLSRLFLFWGYGMTLLSAGF